MSNQKLIFCFTFAGGTAAFYNQIEKCLAPDITLIKLEYAGHGSRYKEKLYDTFEEMVDDLYVRVKQEVERVEENGEADYSLMGYSMGSISAVEMLKKIIARKEIKEPRHVFLAAHEPFTKAELLDFKEDEIDEYVKERTIRFGGIPKELRNNNSFWRLYLPIYRSDYTMIARYDFSKLLLKTNVAATVFYSETDTKYKDMRKWKRYFTGSCDFIEYEGSHFFINDHYEEMAFIIKSRLE